jgi:asparaginyl-tRNA synthetase
MSLLGRRVVSGWIRHKRRGKNVGFVELVNGSHALQCVLNPVQIDPLTVGSAVTFQGEMVESEGHQQSHELRVDNVKVDGECDQTFPIQPKRHGLDFLRSFPHLRHRTRLFESIMRVRHRMTLALHDFFDVKTKEFMLIMFCVSRKGALFMFILRFLLRMIVKVAVKRFT